MATTNRLLPIMTGVVALVVAGIAVQKCTGDPPVKAGDPMKTLPKVQGSEDGDTVAESLRSVTASNDELRREVQTIIEQNRKLQFENDQLKRGGGQAPAATSRATPAGRMPPPPSYDALIDFGELPTAAATGTTAISDPTAMPQVPAGASAEDAPAQHDDSPLGSLGRALDDATNTVSTLGRTAKSALPDTSAIRNAARGQKDMLPPVQTVRFPDEAEGAVSYKTLPPLGWQAVQETAGKGRIPTVRYVRTSAAAQDVQTASTARAVAKAKAEKPRDEPYFTLPVNSTLVNAVAMTAIVGRVPIDGRVTDPMQFKAIVGRENLAANGWELADDIEGVIISGIAVGDMALSCSEGHIRSLTFVFNDGTIRSVSSRATTTSINTTSSTNRDNYLGYISDLHGNPCIVGKFVTNAPAYLTDVVGLKALEAAAAAYASSQTTTNQTSDGGFTSAVTGSAGRYALGAAVSGGSSEVSNWLLSRLKNSFDAVVTPSGQTLVIHLTQEIKLDKAVNARKIIHRSQAAAGTQRGGFHGLE